MIVVPQALSATPAAPVVRLPSNDPVKAMKVLDAGQPGADPHPGQFRGWGHLCGEGFDGIFVGPNDLALNLGLSASSDSAEPEDATIQCLVAAKAAGKRGGIFCPCGAVARRRAAEGFDLVAPCDDAHPFKVALAAELRDSKPDHRRAI